MGSIDAGPVWSPVCEIRPAERTAALRSSVPNLVFDRTIEQAGHNDIYARSDFQEAMRDGLAALTGERYRNAR